MIFNNQIIFGGTEHGRLSEYIDIRDNQSGCFRREVGNRKSHCTLWFLYWRTRHSGRKIAGWKRENLWGWGYKANYCFEATRKNTEFSDKESGEAGKKRSCSYLKVSMHCDFRLKVLFMHEYEMLEKANCYVARVISPDAFLWKENKILYKEFWCNINNYVCDITISGLFLHRCDYITN